jgi:hypothetical protein
MLFGPYRDGPLADSAITWNSWKAVFPVCGLHLAIPRL